MTKIRSTMMLALLLIVPVLSNAQQSKAASAIVIDNTGSMRPQLEFVLSLAGEAGGTLLNRGPASVFNFEFHKDGAKQLATLNSGSAWHSTADQMWKTINGVKIAPGYTQLIDAIDTARIVVASKVRGDHLDQGIIVLITDGEDRASDLDIKKLIEVIRTDKIQIFAIGLVDSVPSKDRATKLLKRLTKETGGKAIFPKLKDLKKMQDFQPLITELFTPSPQPK